MVEAIGIVDNLAETHLLDNYHFFYIARGELLVRLDRPQEATGAYRRALELSQNEVDRAFVTGKLDNLQASVAE